MTPHEAHLFLSRYKDLEREKARINGSYQDLQEKLLSQGSGTDYSTPRVQTGVKKDALERRVIKYIAEEEALRAAWFDVSEKALEAWEKIRDTLAQLFPGDDLRGDFLQMAYLTEERPGEIRRAFLYSGDYEKLKREALKEFAKRYTEAREEKAATSLW